MPKQEPSEPCLLNDKYPSWSATIRFPVASFSGWCDFCCLLLALRLLHTVTGQVQLQDHAVVNQSVNGSRSGHRVFENVLPLGERQVAGNQHTPALVALG